MAKRLLLVDDEPQNLKLLDVLLTPAGYELVTASSGAEAIATCKAGGIDLVLLDLMMPEMDGFGVLTHLRKEPTARHIPVILVTAANDRDTRLRAIELGADDFLEKPIDRGILLARVRTLLALQEATDALVERNLALERLQHMQRELSQFIVHDLKSPIAAISMNVTWAREELGPDLADVVEALADAELAAERVLGMLGDLLIVSKIDDDALPLNRQPVMLAELANDVLRSHKREADDRRITFRSWVEDGLSVNADRALLRRVLDNLVGNALRHTPPDGRIAVAAAHDGRIRLAVSNTGLAIPADERSRIFERFRRGGEGGTSLVNVGLGLHFCRRVVEAHGGTIEVTETSEFPTSFVLRLPSAA